MTGTTGSINSDIWFLNKSKMTDDGARRPIVSVPAAIYIKPSSPHLLISLARCCRDWTNYVSRASVHPILMHAYLGKHLQGILFKFGTNIHFGLRQKGRSWLYSTFADILNWWHQSWVSTLTLWFLIRSLNTFVKHPHFRICSFLMLHQHLLAKCVGTYKKFDRF